MSFLIFFLILSILVLIHEFGHFFVAKRSSVKVHEFGLGLPPKVFSKKIGETEYSYNLLPIGGFVRIEGEDPDEKVSEPKRSFQNKPVSIRLAILLAGIFMNTVLAVVIFYFYFIFNNFVSNPLIRFADYNFIGAETKTLETVVSQVTNEAAIDKIVPGDTIFNAVNNENTLTNLTVADLENDQKNINIAKLSDVSLEKFQEFVNNAEGEVTLYLYNVQTGDTKEVAITPQYNEELNRKIVGVLLGPVFYLDYGQSFTSKLFSGFTHSYNVLGYSMSTLAKLVSFSVETRDVSVVSEGVSGPVGIFSVVDGVLKSQSPYIFWIIIDLVGLLSLSLAFMNLLPIPALDGGRALFVMLEGITGKRINPTIESQIHKYGMIFLLGLIALITFKDVWMLF